MAKKPKKEAPKRLHAFVATPAYNGQVDTDYAISLAESCQVATMYGINVTACIMANGAFIDLARNNFVRLFLESKATHLFFIDADLRWEARAFVSLIMAEKPVAAGVYPKRQDPEEYPVRPKEHPEGGLWVDGAWVMCDRVATGFLCIERSVVEEMAAKARMIHLSGREPSVPELFYTTKSEAGHFIGEDFAWCMDYVEQYQRMIHVWPDFDFTHGRRWKGNWHNFLNSTIIKEGLDKKESTQWA